MTDFLEWEEVCEDRLPGPSVMLARWMLRWECARDTRADGTAEVNETLAQHPK